MAMERLYKYDKPTIAMVEGYCVGGAFMQLCAVDFAVAAEDAIFSLSEVNWGILPGALVSKVVSDTILPRHALYYACMGDAFDAKEAERIGLINFAVSQKDLRSKVLETSRQTDGEEPQCSESNQASRSYGKDNGFRTVLRLPGRERPSNKGWRRSRLIQHWSQAIS